MGLKNRDVADACPTLDAYTSPLKPMERPLVGRSEEMRSLKAALMRPELCNVILLAEAGAGKTALVQGLMAKDTDRDYLEVDLSKMLADLQDKNQMATRIKNLFDETAYYIKLTGREVVLFIDEFHQIVQLSDAAVEALKPMLADSGTRGIRVIAATTYTEFRKWIAPNQPLVERLQRFNLKQPGKDVVISILKGMASKYGVAGQFYNDNVYELIYEYTERYIPANSQPRKSILLLDTMIGWYRAEHRKLDQQLLADVLYYTEGVNVAFRVDPTSIKKLLDKRVLAQEFATNVIEQRLQICVAGLNDRTKPMSSFLFSGSTGSGKSTTVTTRIPVWTSDGSVTHKQAGEVRPGDYVFDRTGKPTKVLGVFPQGEREVYRVTLGDGRWLDVSDNHLWAVYPAKRPRYQGPTIYTTASLLERGLETRHHDRIGMKYFIPANGAVEWPERQYDLDPYAMGALIGDGSLSANNELVVSSDDEFVVAKIASLVGAEEYVANESNYDWRFHIRKGEKRCVSQKDVLGKYPEVYRKKSPERRIPKAYMTGSVTQRWALVRGLFDTDGSVYAADGDRYRVSYSTHSKELAYDVQELLYSLGISSSIYDHTRENGLIDYEVYPMVDNDRKPEFFSLPKKRDIALKAVGVNRQRKKTYDYVGIRSIEKLGHKEEMVCFYVDNDEHLYQAGQYVVTHNTEMTKAMAALLFNDDRNLIRMDMTEYSLPESLERFRAELTARVWEHPYSIVLLDEIEKACAQVTRLLLQVLDDGRLIDANNREVTFLNAYIVMTTNAGSEIYDNIAQYNVDDTGSGQQMKKYNKLIRRSITETTGDNKFPPELLGRIDCLVPFQPLSEATMKRIARRKLFALKERVEKTSNVTLMISEKVITYLVEDNLDTKASSGGARIIASKLESEVVTPVARFINAHKEVRKIRIDVAGEMAAENKYKLESSAYIEVSAVG